MLFLFEPSEQNELQTVKDILISRRIHHVPVVEEGKMVGLVSIDDLFKSNIERADYHFNSEMADTYDEGLAVENIKVEIYKNDFQQNNIIRTIEGKIDEVKFDLEDFAQKDTAYLHIYSPDNRYWGKWKINRKITSID